MLKGLGKKILKKAAQLILPGGSTFRNIMTENGSAKGTVDFKMLGKDMSIDIIQLAIVILVLLAAFGIMDWEAAEKGKELLK